MKHLLPVDAWAAWRNGERTGEFDEESVLLFDQSAVIEKLHLDAPFDEVEHVFLIVVQGDLTIEKYIYNEDTDGAAGLIVLGDLRVRNMLVGGQEIYVTGSLIVAEVFWGDYNHGDLHVVGNATSTVFVETDDYSVNIEGQSSFTHYLDQYGSGNIATTGNESESPYQGLNEQLVRELFVPEFILSDDDGTTLVRDEFILARLEAGLSLLKR
ncbi:MAG TPA: hypothetical protein VF629_03460 [Hymenobacter sp.]|uniref:hypothetical protein n=1 Tax=Hymenobacter sp. TaxID=1898978 RepID=UPI002ED784EE